MAGFTDLEILGLTPRILAMWGGADSTELAGIHMGVDAIDAALMTANTYQMVEDSALAAAHVECCKAQFGKYGTAADFSFEIPGPCESGTDANGDPTCEPGDPIPFTATNQTQMNAALIAWQQSQQTSMWDSWIAEFTKYNDTLNAIQIPIMLGQVCALTEMYQNYTFYLGKTNEIICKLKLLCDELKEEYDSCVKGEVSKKMKLMSEEFSTRWTNVNDATDWACDRRDNFWNCYFNDGTATDPDEQGAGYAILEKQHVQNMAQHMANICSDAQHHAGLLGTILEEHNMYTEDHFRDFEIEAFSDITEHIRNLYEKQDEICEYQNMCGQMLIDCYNNPTDGFLFGTPNPDGTSNGIKDMLMQQIEYAQDCTQEISNAHIEHRSAMNQLKAKYQQYHDEQCKLGPGIITDAAELLDCENFMKTCYEYLRDGSYEFKERYDLNWEINEEELSNKILELACKAAATSSDEQYEWAKMLAVDCYAQYEDCYKDGECQLAQGLLSEALMLYNTRKETFDWFCEKADKHLDFWMDFYLPKEQAYACTLMQKAEDQICILSDQLVEYCAEGEEHLEFYKNYYKNPECEISPKLILASEKACDQQQNTYMYLDMYLDHLWEKWESNFCKCDIDDLNALCEVLEKRNLGCEIDENNECAQEVGTTLKNCYLDIYLPCEKDYIDELCDMDKYEPQYCEVEDRSIAYIKAAYSQQREELIRCSKRHCSGNLDQQLKELAVAQVKEEAAALQTANRFERWWEVHECDRRHRYKLDMIRAAENFRESGLAALNQSSQGNSQLLTHLQERIVRGYQYLTNMNDAGRSVISSVNNAVAQGQRGIEAGHFYPQLHHQMKSEHHRSSESMILRGQEQVRIGHYHTQQAAQDKGAAENVAASTLEQGLAAMRIGQDYKRLSLAASQQAEKTAQDQLTNGIAMIDRGHFWIQESRAWKMAAYDSANQGVASAMSSIRQGHEAMELALAYGNARDGVAQSCIDNGHQSAADAMQIMQAGEVKVQRSLEAALQGMQQAFQMMDIHTQRQQQNINGHLGNTASAINSVGALNSIIGNGHNLARMAMQTGTAYAQNEGQLVEMIMNCCKEHHNSMIRSIQSNQGLANQTSALLSEFGSGVSGTFSDLAGTLTGFFSAPPQINNTFNGPRSTGVNSYYDLNFNPDGST